MTDRPKTMPVLFCPVGIVQELHGRAHMAGKRHGRDWEEIASGQVQEMTEYSERRTIEAAPRWPFHGIFDLTHRCNNNCRHCWLRIPSDAPEKARELTFEEICGIVDQARQAGTREVTLTGGEPMLRPDFVDIFDYVIGKSLSYRLNTNGTLITSKIARLLRHKGSKMVALYGATADVHDYITRNPGSFESALRGMRYMKEARARFVVQIVPLRDNRHQWEAMMDLAHSYSPQWRYGATWLWLSAYGSPERSAEISRQRIDPTEVVGFDPPDVSWDDGAGDENADTRSSCTDYFGQDDRLFASCIGVRTDFHIDPYGEMSFCPFVKAPFLRFDLHRWSFREVWDELIPSVPALVRGDAEWRENCGSCQNRSHCRWCAAYAYLETGRFSAPLSYLCQVAQESKRYREEWLSRHRRFFEIAGITIRLESALPMDRISFPPAIEPFEVKAPGEDVVAVTHVFGLPDVSRILEMTPVYRNPPWAVYKYRERFVYTLISPDPNETELYRVAEFSPDFRRCIIYSRRTDEFEILANGLPSLTLFPTDQILVAQLLASRQGCYLHAAGLVLEGSGLLFVGQSGAGKSTTVRMLKGNAEILCDDRMIVRHWPSGLRIHGTWHHGEVPDVSPNSANLQAIFFLKKATENRLEPIRKQKGVARRLLTCLVKPLATREWCEPSLHLIEELAGGVPCYEMYFDESGEIVSHIREVALGLRGTHSF